MKKIECLIMDWAGTAVDYGCFAPVAAFVGAFADVGLHVTAEEVRRPMGLAKRDHVRELLLMSDVNLQFYTRNMRHWRDDDVEEIYNRFEQRLFKTLGDYAEPIPGVVDTIGLLRHRGLRIGSTTGYTQAMMDVVRPAAATRGYTVDACVCPDGLPAGRPQPYMIFRNMTELAVGSLDTVVKCGDTEADMAEGRNARVWTVGVVTGGNGLGLTPDEVAALAPAELERRKAEVRERLTAAGAHYVADTIEELPLIIDTINMRINASTYDD